MPTYEYRCRKCGHQFEVFHGIRDESPRRCPKCGSRAHRVPTGGAGLLFKGSGFYITDYRSKTYKEKARQERAAGGAGTPPPGKPGGKSPSAD
jgi:putative FmdB family regulatory protein